MRHGFIPLSLILAAALAAPAGAQSMGEAAAKERQRREKLRQGKPAPKVITEEDLRGAGAPRGTISNPAATEEAAPDPNASPAPAASPGAAPAAGAKPEKTEDEVRTERQAEWRKRLDQAQKDAQNLTQRVEQIQLKLNDVSGGGLYSSSRANLVNELETTKALLATARQTLANLEEEGRRNGYR